jgi:YHS domain-containing protein
MRESGTVVSTDDGIARVEFVPKEACEHCGAKGFCHPSPGKMVAEAVNELGAQVGDEATIETGVAASIQAAALIFLAPIAGLIGGYLLAKWIWKSEGAGAIGGVVLMAALIGVLAYLDRRVLRPKRFMPRIVSVVRREVSTLAKDPVCGMDVSEETTLKTEHSGKTYYFCCETCKTSFEKTPDEYTKEE